MNIETKVDDHVNVKLVDSHVKDCIKYILNYVKDYNINTEQCEGVYNINIELCEGLFGEEQSSKELPGICSGMSGSIV